MSTPALGERLRQLRTTLAEEDFDSKAWSRARVAREAGVPSTALTRLENTGRGTAATLAAVLCFYQNQGFNLAWVLNFDNEAIPLHAFRDIFEEEARQKAGYQLERVHQVLQPVAAALTTGELPTPEALPPLLKKIRQGIHQALVHLLPPMRLVGSAADLQEYQRRLPPVRAAAAGWRSAVVHERPYHYYEAGDSFPRCGNPTCYLAYDPGPQEVADSNKCSSCRT